ncbi:HNH endonuclease [Chloroflexota bacterium]
MSICLSCKTEGAFRTKEHIIPESLGNDTDILKNVICERCQNYFGREIEKPALEKTNLAVWRSYLGIRTKKNHFPSVNLDPPLRGAIPSLHPVTEFGVGFTAYEDGSTSINVSNPPFKKRLLNDKSAYLLVMTPWHLSILGRFLGKVGLELLALTDIDHALSAEFDQIRSFIRFGSTKHLWPIYYGQHGKLTELKGPIIWDGLYRTHAPFSAGTERLQPEHGALWASLKGAYDKGEPWIGKVWGPTWIADLLDLTVLEQEPYSVKQSRHMIKRCIVVKGRS